MTPFGLVAFGYVLALLDMRVQGFDVMLDALGWLLVVVGLSRLHRTSPLFARTRVAAVVAGVLSLADLVQPLETVSTGTGTTTRAVQPDGLQGVAVTVYGVAMVVFAVLLSLAVREAARGHADAANERTFTRFAVLHAVLGAAATVALVVGLLVADARSSAPAVSAPGLTTTGVEGPAAALLVIAVLGLLALEIWFVVALARLRRLPWLSADDPAVVASAPDGGPGPAAG
jgi:hypothetical protein